MIFKKKYLLFTFFLIIIIFQILLHTNNNQRVSIRYLKWTVQEVSLGKLISISFYSGLFISALLNTTITGNKKNTFENVENYEPLNDEEDIKSNVEMPPQRDIRDSQPTISVNYRVVQNGEENYSKSDQNFSEKPNDKNDWVNDDNDW